MIKTRRKFLTFGKPDISEEELIAVNEVLRSGWIGTGKIAKEFEKEFLDYMGGGYAVAVSSGTMGLILALRSVGLVRGDNVLTTPLTFCATVNAIIEIGAHPVFTDVNEDGLLGSGAIKERYLQGMTWLKPCCILPVNYLGKSANFKIRPFDWPIVEDAAHSFGGNCGYGDVSVFSFYATKNVTSGEGGMIWTRSKELADKCRLLSNHGQTSGAWSRYSSGPIENYQILHPGYKGNLPDLLAAVGLAQLRRWPILRKKRNVVWSIYEQAFGKKGLGHSKHLYTIRVKNRSKLREDLYNKGIGTGIHYEALHLQPAYRYLGYMKGDFPVAERIGAETLSLPISATMYEEDAHYVVKHVKENAHFD